MNLFQTCTVILEEVSQGLPEDRESVFLGCGNFSNILNPVWKLTKDSPLSFSLPICLHGCTVASVRVGESRRLAWMHVINGTRIVGTRRVRTDWEMPVNWSESWRWSSFVEEACTGWGAQARWSAGAQEWRRVTRGHERGRTVTLARMKLTEGVKSRKGRPLREGVGPRLKYARESPI